MSSAWFCDDSGPDIVEFAGTDANEQLIAYLFTRTWAHWSGHPVPAKPSRELSREELIDFWADDDVVWL